MISLETPQRKWASSHLEGRTSWIFSSCGRCSRLTTGTSGTRSGGLRKGQFTCKLLVGFSGVLSLRCRGLRPCVESVPDPEHSSPVLTWILGYFWSLARGPPTSRGDPFLPHSSRGGILSLCGRERIPRVTVASQEEALSTGKVRGTSGS